MISSFCYPRNHNSSRKIILDFRVLFVYTWNCETCPNTASYKLQVKTLLEDLNPEEAARNAEARDAKRLSFEPKLTVKDFCRGVLNSTEYRESLYRRVLLDELPPAVECMMWDRAWGKTVEKVEIKDTTAPLEALTVEELEARALYLVGVARRLRDSDTDTDTTSDTTPTGAIH